MDYDVSAKAIDPDFVRFQVFLEERKNLKIVKQTHLDFHLCTQADFDEFYEISIDKIDFAR